MEILEGFKNNQNDVYLNNSNFIDALVSLNNAVNECLNAGFSYVNALLNIRTEIISDLFSRDEDTATAVLEQNKIDLVKYEDVEDEED